MVGHPVTPSLSFDHIVTNKYALRRCEDSELIKKEYVSAAKLASATGLPFAAVDCTSKTSPWHCKNMKIKITPTIRYFMDEADEKVGGRFL
jgi:hypothetical protein